MRKIELILLGGLLLFSVGVFAQTAEQDVKKERVETFQRGRFVDKNNDSICDNWQNRPPEGRGFRQMERQNDSTRYRRYSREPRANQAPRNRNFKRGRGGYGEGRYYRDCPWRNDFDKQQEDK